MKTNHRASALQTIRELFLATLPFVLLLAGCATAAPTAVPPAPTPTPAPVAAPEMVLVEPGSFQMGSSAGRPEESPVHQVRITRAFELGKYEVTFDEYDRLCADTHRTRADDGGRGRGRLPVINVNWYDAAAYCNWLSEQHGLTPVYSGSGKTIRCDWEADGYRLPTEAEWEYAARGGALGRGTLYAGSENPDEVIWYEANSGNLIYPGGQNAPNELGLYDRHGKLPDRLWNWYGAD